MEDFRTACQERPKVSTPFRDPVALAMQIYTSYCNMTELNSSLLKTGLAIVAVNSNFISNIMKF